MALQVGSLSALLMGLMTIFPTTVQERDGDQEIPVNASHEQFVLGVPSERESETLNQWEHHQQEADVERPTGIASEQASGDRVGGNASDPIQSDGSERECQQPRDDLYINILWMRAKPRGMGISGRSSSQWTRKLEDSVLSKPFCPSFMFITRCVSDPLLTVPV